MGFLRWSAGAFVLGAVAAVPAFGPVSFGMASIAKVLFLLLVVLFLLVTGLGWWGVRHSPS